MSPAIRPYRDGDAAACAAVFHDAVRRGAGPDYDEAQRAAWSAAPPDSDRWRERLRSATTLVAEDGGEVVGFVALRADGHLDLAFVRSDRIGTGVAARLYDALLDRARAARLRALTADASYRLRPFLERRGWRVVREQHPVRNGVRLTNFRMETELEEGAS